MKILPNTFKKNGFTFEQLMRKDNVAIYAKRLPHWPDDKFSYETVIIRANPAWSAFGQTFAASESYPPSTEWGRLGFSDVDLTSANHRMVSLNGPNA